MMTSKHLLILFGSNLPKYHRLAKFELGHELRTTNYTVNSARNRESDSLIRICPLKPILVYESFKLLGTS